MSSISSASFASQAAQRPPSPRDRLQSELQSAIQSGEIASTDESALSTALDTIDSTLRAERGSGGGRTAPPSPDEMKEKISGLIDEQVEAGTLTEEQASALEEVFANVFANGPGGPPPPPPPEEGADTGGVSATGSTGTDQLADLLKQLQQALKGGSDYGADGSSASGEDTTGLILDMLA